MIQTQTPAGSRPYGALLCEHVYDCNGCGRLDNVPESFSYTPEDYGRIDDEEKELMEVADGPL